MLFLLHYYLLASKDKLSSPHFILRIFSALVFEKKLTVPDLNCLEDVTLSYAVFWNSVLMQTFWAEMANFKWFTHILFKYKTSPDALPSAFELQEGF